MSFAVFQQLTQTQVIDACLFASFTGPDANNLIVSKGDRLEVYDVQRKQNKLGLLYSVPLFGRPEALASFRPQPDGPEHLAVVLRRARYLAVLRHDSQLGSARTCGQHLLMPTDDPASLSGPVGFRPQVSVDPANRCVAVRVLPDRVLVFPVACGSSWQKEVQPAVTKHGALAFHEDVEVPPCLGAPFPLGNRPPLRLHHIQDIAFLHGYQQPTAVCLGQTKPAYGGCLNEANLCTSSVLVFTLDLTERVPHMIWASHRLPHDIFRVVPLQMPIGGMLALCTNAVIYMKEHGASFCQALNPCADLGNELAKLKGIELKDEKSLDIQLNGSSVGVLSPTTLLFSVLPLGRLYCAHLVMESHDVVADIVWTSPGVASPAASMCCLGEDYVYLAGSAAAGGCSLLKLTPSRKKLPPSLQKQQPTKRQRTAEPGEGEGVPQKQEEQQEEQQAKEPSKALKELLESHRALQDAGRHIRSYKVEVCDDLPGFGAIPCFAPWCRDRGEDGEDDDAAPLAGAERLICCSGSGQKGALYVCQRAVPLDVLTEFDLPETSQFSAVWTFQHPKEEPVIAEAEAKAEAEAPDEVTRAAAAASAAAVEDNANASHRLVLVSGGFKTMLLETTEEIEELSKHTKLDVDATTIAAGSTGRGKILVQVTPLKLCFLLAGDPKCNEVPPRLVFDASEIPVQACGGAVSDPYVAVCFHDFHLRLFAAYGDAGCPELTDRLPEAVRVGVLSVSLFRGRDRRTLMVVLTAPGHGTLRILDLENMAEVFRATHVLEVPPVLRNHTAGSKGCATDHLRAVSDVCAPLPRGVAERAAKDEAVEAPASAAELRGQCEAAAARAVCAELVEVDAEDCGPTLVLQLVGRPVLVYRPFVATRASEEPVAFPYHFSVFEHDLLGLVERAPGGPHRPVAPMRQPGGSPSGAVILPPHGGLPALWLAARRGQLFVHPLPGDRLMGFSQLRAPCCESGFFALSAPPEGAVAAQVLAPAIASGLQGGALQGGSPVFDLQWPLPAARHVLKRTPHVMATRPEDGLLGIAVSDMVLESTSPPDGDDENDPLAEDFTIVRKAPVEFSAPPVPRSQPRFEIWIDDAKHLAKLGRYRFPLEHGEHVLSMEWVTIPGFPNPSLAVGTGVNVGEDLTCRGRILIFSTRDRDPGILPAVYERSLKSPVTVVGQWGNYLLHAEGFKLYYEKWENNAFQKLAFFDSSMCVTAMSSIRNFVLLGDLRRGLDFVQWKEEKEGNTRNLRRLSRSPPSGFMTVLACDFVVCGKSLGLVALDHKGTAHLYQYTPHSDGREGDQLLKSCATFSMGFPCRAALRLRTDTGAQCLFMASGGGELLCLRPIDDTVYRILATLLGMLSTRLPYRCGLNPRAFRHHEGPPALVAPRKNIEDAVLLRQFAFLSGPLQDAIAEKMRLPLLTLLKAALPCGTCQLLSLSPFVPGKTAAA